MKQRQTSILRTGLLIPLATYLSIFHLACAKYRPSSSIPTPSFTSLNQTLDELGKNHVKNSSLSGFAQVRIRSRGKQESFDAIFLVQAPDKLLIDILDDLGRQRFHFVADGEEVLWFETGSGEYHHLPQQSDSLKKALRLPLSVEEFIARLLGIFPKEKILEVRKDPEFSPPVWQVYQSSEALGIQETPARLVYFKAFKKPQSSKVRYTVSYVYPSQARPTHPSSIQWTLKKPKAKVWIYFSEADWGTPIPSSRFDTNPPFGQN